MAPFKLVPPTAGRVTSPFGQRVHPVTKKTSMHKGVDIAKPGRHDVVAAADGVVIRTVKDAGYWGYGLTVIVRHSNMGTPFETLYAHLDAVNVVVGQRVKQGQKIGLQGNTGTSTGQHLHFEVHRPAYAPYQPHAVDPMDYIVWPEIEESQRLLNLFGFNLTVDGILGPNTTKSIKEAQKRLGLVADGVFGPQTLKALKSVVNKPVEPKPVVTKPITETGDDEMLQPSSGTLNKAIEEFLQEHIKAGRLEPKWLATFKSGKLSVSDFIGLQIIVAQRAKKE